MTHLPARNAAPPKAPAQPAQAHGTPGYIAKKRASGSPHTWACIMANRIKAALGDETPVEVLALILPMVRGRK